MGGNRSKWPRLARLLRREEGSELLEFALVVIVLLLLVFGTMDFSRAMYCYHYVSNASREGTRYAIVRGSACTGFPDSCPANLTDVETHVKSSTPALDPAAVSVVTTWTPNNKPGSSVKVQVGYRYKVMFPFAFPFLPNGTISMSSSSQMIISQ